MKTKKTTENQLFNVVFIGVQIYKIKKEFFCRIFSTNSCLDLL